MTGIVFASVSKYIEIGNIVDRVSNNLLNTGGASAEEDDKNIKKRIKKANDKDLKKLNKSGH